MRLQFCFVAAPPRGGVTFASQIITLHRHWRTRPAVRSISPIPCTVGSAPRTAIGYPAAASAPRKSATTSVLAYVGARTAADTAQVYSLHTTIEALLDAMFIETNPLH